MQIRIYSKGIVKWAPLIRMFICQKRSWRRLKNVFDTCLTNSRWLSLRYPAVRIALSYWSLHSDLVVEMEMYYNWYGYLSIINGERGTFRNLWEMLFFLIDRYGVMLDFSCGYGLTARVATICGRPFICSDVNGKCIYHIAKHYMGYTDAE